MKQTTLILLAILLLTACGLEPEDDTDLPNWLDKKIVAVQDSTYFPPMECIWQYDYNDKPVYLFCEGGIDTYQILYNRFGIEIGRAGGYGGIIIGVYDDFNRNRTNGVIIWACDELLEHL